MYDLFESLSKMQPPLNMIVLVVLIGCGAGAFGTLATQIRKYFCHRQEMELKRDLVASGLSFDEIERVVAAKSSTKSTV